MICNHNSFNDYFQYFIDYKKDSLEHASQERVFVSSHIKVSGRDTCLVGDATA